MNYQYNVAWLVHRQVLYYQKRNTVSLPDIQQQWFNKVNSAGEAEIDGGEKQKKSNLPKRVRLRATILVNVRPTVGIQVIYLFLFFEQYHIAICSNAMKNVNSKITHP